MRKNSKMKKLLFYLAVNFLCLSNIAFSQGAGLSESYHNFGLFANYNYVRNNADFANLPDVNIKGAHFISNYGSGASYGALYNYFSGNYGLELGFGYNTFKGNFNSSYIETRKVDKNEVSVQHDHNLDFNFKSYCLLANAKVFLFDRFCLSAGIGINFNRSSSYSQTEHLIIPKGRLVLPDSIIEAKGRFVLNELSGSISGLQKTQFLAGAKISYDLQVSNTKSIIVRPELGFDYVFTPMISNLTWNMLYLKLGVSFLYSTSKAVTDYASSEALIKQSEKIVILNKEYESKLIENKKLEENIQNLKSERERCERLLMEKDSMLKADTLTAFLEKAKIENERQEMNKMIDEENRIKGRKCECYVILFLSTTEKDVADRLIASLLSNRINYVTTSQFVDPYLNETYYRVQSKCYDNHNDAFDDRLKIRDITNKLNLIPQVRCDK